MKKFHYRGYRVISNDFCSLTHFMPLISLISSENIRKSLDFWCFQEVSKEISGMKWVKSNIWKKHKYRTKEFVFLLKFFTLIPNHDSLGYESNTLYGEYPWELQKIFPSEHFLRYVLFSMKNLWTLQLSSRNLREELKQES